MLRSCIAERMCHDMEKRKKMVQITEELFRSLLIYFMCESNENEEFIRQELQKKLDSMVLRELYTKSKSANTPEEREKARQEYLDKVGIGKDFRW